MGGSVQRLSNGRIYIEGEEAFATCKSLELPEIEIGQTEYDALGTTGVLELPNSKVQAMEATIVWMHQPNTFGFTELMYNPMRTSQIEVRADQAIFDGLGEPIPNDYVCVLRGRPKEMSVGSFEGNDDTMPETVMAVDFLRLAVGGQELLEINARSTFGIRVNGRLVNMAISGSLV